MMTREKIKKLIADYGSSMIYFGMDLGSGEKNPADEICDALELKTCGNCEYWNGAVYCKNFSMAIPHTPKCEDFGCNKWESKQND